MAATTVDAAPPLPSAFGSVTNMSPWRTKSSLRGGVCNVRPLTRPLAEDIHQGFLNHSKSSPYERCSVHDRDPVVDRRLRLIAQAWILLRQTLSMNKVSFSRLLCIHSSCWTSLARVAWCGTSSLCPHDHPWPWSFAQRRGTAWTVARKSCRLFCRPRTLHT